MPGFERGLAFAAVTGQELIEPGARHPVGREDLGDGSLLDEDGGDDQAGL